MSILCTFGHAWKWTHDGKQCRHCPAFIRRWWR